MFCTALYPCVRRAAVCFHPRTRVRGLGCVVFLRGGLRGLRCALRMRNTGHDKEHDSGCDYQWRFHVGSFIYVEFSIHAIRYSRALSSNYSSLRTSQGRFSSSRRPTAPGALDECPSALLSYSFLVRRNAVATHMRRRWTAIVGERCRHCHRPIPVTCRILAARRRAFLNCPGAGRAHVTSRH
jgi:hypothetical protein